jgi:hypothetical protein
MTYTPHTVWIGGPPAQQQKPKPLRKIWRKDSLQNRARDEFIAHRIRAGEPVNIVAMQVGLTAGRYYEISKGMEA